MAGKGQSPRFLKSLRKKHKLGEFSKPKRRKIRTRNGPAKNAMLASKYRYPCGRGFFRNTPGNQKPWQPL